MVLSGMAAIGRRCKRLFGLRGSAPAFVFTNILFIWCVYLVVIRQVPPNIWNFEISFETDTRKETPSLSPPISTEGVSSWFCLAVKHSCPVSSFMTSPAGVKGSATLRKPWNALKMYKMAFPSGIGDCPHKSDVGSHPFKCRIRWIISGDPGFVNYEPISNTETYLEVTITQNSLIKISLFLQRVRYCKHCHAHVKGFDHHCPAFGNCIAEACYIVGASQSKLCHIFLKFPSSFVEDHPSQMLICDIFVLHSTFQSQHLENLKLMDRRYAIVFSTTTLYLVSCKSILF
ncbi:hypothetical protein E3N88_36125 [Mikania micrantha]|uniref:S-acyltransferase n=1 Tax=Mikania micrantha TaxID=192012 RepID=A0A5N6M2W2_9ASTR|nr:hypothetical protein E3N88_36125 [Mikania micrantha]